MFNTLSNKKGMTMIEVVIALFLLGIGVLALISLQPSAWRLSGKSDYLGRASGILAAQLQTIESQIMNPNNALPAGGTGPVYASGWGGTQKSAAPQGDVEFTVVTTITPVSGTTNTWSVNVQVTWPGNNTGIKESMVVAQQQSFSQ
jgi:prepilin-type N-terminal cleavage/methylation domain-containing protein